jgi:hypothetical protein
MPDSMQALARLREDVIQALTRLEVQITALEYAAVQQQGSPITAERLEQLQHAAESDAAVFRAHYEETIRPI